MADFVPAEGAFLDQILETTYEIWGEGLSRAAYRSFYTAQAATPWGKANLRRYALVAGTEVQASGKLYSFRATLDGRPVRVAGLGAIFTAPAQRGRGAARELIDRMLERASVDGADLALLFSEIGSSFYEQLDFTPIPIVVRTLRVTEDERRGAPAMMVRGGEERDLADLAVLAQLRAAPFRFHLDRDRDLIRFSIAKKRLLAGLGAPGARQVQFFIAEEGASAVAYVVVSVTGRDWTLEEAGDRDPSFARVGAIMQALIARDHVERRPAIAGWLPVVFLPPQLAIVGERPTGDVMMIRALTPAGKPERALREEDVLYWHNDMF